MSKKALTLPFLLLLQLLVPLSFSLHATTGLKPVVKKEQRRTLVSTEYGEITSIEISDGVRGPYHLQFITLDPNALFLPVLLHADMVFYVDTGSGRLSWADEDEMRRFALHRGDISRLEAGTVFFIESNLQPEREKLRIIAMFGNSDDYFYEPSVGPYSGINDMVLGFDKKVLQAAFEVPEEVIKALKNTTKPPPIVHGVPRQKRTFWEAGAQLIKALVGAKGYSMFDMNNKKKKTRTFNILKERPDFKNGNGWSSIVTKKKLPALKGSHIGAFLVNLTKGSMMGPHWNPMATEIAIVIHGRGMVQMVCSSGVKASECKNMTVRTEEGDAFVVPRFHPMAQMSFNNESFVFMGFATTTRKNYPQFLAGKSSVLQTLDRQVVAASFSVSSSTIDQLLAAQDDSAIFECISCAEEEETVMEEEIKREEEQEEARKRAEEAARKKKEEREKEEAAARKKEEERKKKKEEEARKGEEEKRQEVAARKKAEEEARRKEEEKRRAEKEAKEREERREREKEKAREKEEEAENEEAESEEKEARRQEEEREKSSRKQEAAAEEAEGKENAAGKQEE